MFERVKMRKAVAAGDLDRVAALLVRHPELANDLLGEYPRALSIALSNKQDEMVRALIRMGADIHLGGSHGPSMMFDALYAGRMAFVEEWAGENPDMLHQRSLWGESLLHVAVSRNHGPTLAWLLEKGLDVEAMDGRGRTALQKAEAYGYEAMVALLRPYHEKARLVHKKRAHQLAVRDEGVESWKKLDDSRIAHVRNEPEIGYRITAIFNFATSERTRIYRNITTDQESVETTPFDAHTAPSDIAEARQRLIAAGGKPGVAAGFIIAKG